LPLSFVTVAAGTQDYETRGKPVNKRLYWISALFALEILAIVLVFQVFSSVECRLTDIESACRGLRSLLIRGLCVFVALGVFMWFRPKMRRNLLRMTQDGGFGRRIWGFVHLAGLMLIFGPWVAADPGTLNREFTTYFVTLAAGGLGAVTGGVFLLVPVRDLLSWLREGGLGLALVAGVALIIPDLADLLSPLWWSLDGLLTVTFYGVAVMLSLLGQQVGLSPETSVIGTGEFFVEMAGSCSGIEGFALTTGFFVIYALLMGRGLRQKPFWLLVFPAALLVSWLFNLIRITVLILLGAYVSPELAVNGFHSFAGWLFFTILALGVLWVVQAASFLHRDDDTGHTQEAAPGDLPPLREDPVAAWIAPFIVFMLSGLLVHTFWQNPELGYPVQVVLMATALWWFRKPFLELDWKIDPIAVGAGLLVGLGWLWGAGRGSSVPEAGTLTIMSFTTWATLRVLGTSVLVPVIEEAFFRGYLLRWIGGSHPGRTVLAVVVSSVAFALLHGRYVEAGLAGVVFALVALRRGRLADAIIAHAVANTTIAAVAWISGDWSLI
jgi:hypothetical protein